MNYVKHFNINGVNVRQVACIELSGPPNAATEGAVGALAMDTTSPTHEVYRCVAVNGSVYTWELLSGVVAETWKKPTDTISDFAWLYENQPTEVMLYIHCGDSGMTNYKMNSVHLVRTSVDATSVTYEGSAAIYEDYDGYHTIKYSGHLKITFYDTDFVLAFVGMKDYFVGWDDSNMSEWLEYVSGAGASLNFSSGDMDNYYEFNVIAYKGV